MDREKEGMEERMGKLEKKKKKEEGEEEGGNN